MKNNSADFETSKDDVFGRIAARYDLLCDLFSIGIHRLWKRRVAHIIAEEPCESILDIASGTGDIIERILKNKPLNKKQLLVTDISPKMLVIAQQKLEKYRDLVSFELIDAHDMKSIKTSSMQVCSMSLGLKICDRQQAMTEVFRILEPGGRFIALEASNIPISWLHKLYLLYMSLCMPLIGWIATRGDASAYKYLLQGVKDFPSAENLKLEMESIGFQEVTFERLSLGIVAIHSARKPG